MIRNVMLVLVIALLFSSCGSLYKMKQEGNNKAANSKEDERIESLQKAESYVQLAKNAEQNDDTLNAEYYFDQAMEIVSDFPQKYPSLMDSSTQRSLKNISLDYSKYLARLNGLEHDTLTAANVMNILIEMGETLEDDLDSSVVTIPDILEDQQELTIPLVLNKKVENAIKYFQGRGRRVFTKWLQRSGWYQDLIVKILREEGVPEELFYLAMIESGFNPHARSYARAVGIWQFIYATGKAYGLESSWWYDERRDPELATRAAARHLKDLYKRFDNWYLAIAGYNFSPARIESRMRRYNVQEFWDLPRLPRQTRNYVPTFIAAVHIAQDPEKYGFFIEPEQQIVFDTVTVNECVDMNVVANCVGTSFDQIKRLNPALIRWCTPPDKDNWILNIPKGSRDKFLENYAKVPDNQKLTWIHHRIQSGETLSQISQKYGVNMTEIKRFNKIRGTMIRAGSYLVIPVPQNKSYAKRLAKESSRKYTSSYRRSKPVQNVPGRIKRVHVVEQGETLWDIAVKYGVYITHIRQWNGLGSSRIIYPEQKLNIWLPKDSPLLTEKNETQIRENDKITANQTIASVNRKTVTHKVKYGDTLWDIASKYGVSIREIKLWNNMSNNLIKPGDELKIVTVQ